MKRDRRPDRGVGGGAGYATAFAMSLVALVGGGCANNGNPDPNRNAAISPVATVPEPTFQVAAAIEGKVVSVRPDLRYTVVDFSFSHMPKPGEEMAAFRDGRAVGRIRISRNPSHVNGGAVVADILEGEIAKGDEVRFR